MTSDHLDLSFVWSVCVCVWWKFECPFSMYSFAARNKFVSSTKSVHLQHNARSLLAINVFACSVISYSEVSSRGYLVARK